MISMACLTRQLGEFNVVAYDQGNEAYEGMVLSVTGSNQLIRSRLAKKTPKKAGYFAAFWEKNECRENRPFNDQNFPDVLAIVISDGNKQGIFMIPREIAVKKQLISSANVTGKRALRFYPTWCANLNQTALRTQKWQAAYFTDLSVNDG